MSKTNSRQPTTPKLPEGWTIQPLGEIFTFYRSYPFVRASLNYLSGEAKSLHYGDIHSKFNHHLDIEKEKVPFIDKNIDLSRIKTEDYCQEGDLIIADASEDYDGIGKAIEIINLEKQKLLSGLHTFLARDDKDLMSSGFSGYLMNVYAVKLQLMKLATGISVLGISKKNISKVRVLLPPLEEQERIAGILGVWGKGIETIEALIEAKEEAYKWMLASYICSNSDTPKKRFTQFAHADPWKSHQLSKYLSIPKGKKIINIDRKRLLTVRLHLKGLVPSINTSSLVLGATYYERFEGQFIYGKQNLFNGAFGIVSEEFDGFYTSGDVPSLDIDKENILPIYLFTYFSRRDFYRKLEAISNGTGSKRIHEKELLKLRVLVPSLEEQERIAKLLSTAQNEIRILSQIAEQMEKEKRGLMQKLLTGQWTTKTTKTTDNNNSKQTKGGKQ